MLRATIQHIANNPRECKISLDGRDITFADPVDYLYMTDEEFFNQIHPFGDEFVRRMTGRFQRRELFVRCLEISRRTVKKKSWEESFGRKMLLDLSDNPPLLDDAERTIHETLPGGGRGKCERGEVLLSVPKT